MAEQKVTMKNKVFDLIIFDVDSTLVTVEGLDWLARLKGKEREVADLTKQSMNGLVRLEDVFEKKMNLIRPSYKDLANLGIKYCESIVPGVIEVLAALQFLKKEVFILTGNFDPAVSMLAEYLHILEKNVISNDIYFHEDGRYKGFNNKGPLSINGGKKTILKKMIGRKKIVFVGDGATDVEAKNAVDLFVGFGGVVRRKHVEKNSDVYLSGKSMYPLLSIVLSKKEKQILKDKHRKVKT